MRKLLLVGGLLLLVLLLSWWAKGANFSVLTMMQHLPLTQTATSSANPSSATVLSGTPTPTPIPVEILITITPNGFVPDAIMIAPNTKITWVNKTPFTATISSDPSTAYPALNAGDLGENGSVSVVFPKAGRYNYINGKNTSQRGTIIVK